jgi:flagellar biosynthesis protein FlhF
MNLQTFKAPTMAQALAQVRTAMGSDAVILHTRTYQMRLWLGLKRRDVVEIIAGRGIQTARRTKQGTAPATGYGPGFSRGAVLPSAQPTIRGPVENSRQLLQTPAAGNAIMLGINQEVCQLKRMMTDLIKEQRSAQMPQVPQELFEHYLRLIQNQVADELAREIIKTLEREIRPEYLSQPEYVRQRLAEQIEKLVPTAAPIKRKRETGPHVVALIGPTGVGKTTTLAKLAANLKLNQKHRVGLITLDTYRIAAVDQLKRYADIIGSPLRVVGNADDLREAVRSMSNMEFILIDTAGRSPRDTMKLNELRGLLNAIEPDEVHLVLSSTAGQDCVDLAIQRFSEVRVDKIIFTKLDEAAHVGVVLNVVRKLDKRLSYLTTGQDVPNDIEEGRGRRLAQMILGDMVPTKAGKNP